MRRRVFVGGWAGALASLAWPSASDGQPRSTSLRRIGVLTAFGAGDPEGQVRLGVFRQRLEELGWTETHNLKMDYPALVIRQVPCPRAELRRSAPHKLSLTIGAHRTLL